MIIEPLPVKTPTEFRQTMESRGWSPETLAVRWRVTRRRIQQIMADPDRPRYYDDSVENLPVIVSGKAKVADKPIRIDADLVGNWLWRGGRLRVLKKLTINSGDSFEPGEIIRLVRLDRYRDTADFASMNFVSEKDPAKSLCMTGWGSQSNAFEVL